MLKSDFQPSGRRFVRVPGPSPLLDRILRAKRYPAFVHRGPECGALRLTALG
jgi:hypothetical protein